MVQKLANLVTAAGTRYIVVDLEATCWEGEKSAPNEIIEIGAVAYDVGHEILGDFQIFVKPQLSPVLSDFCTKLTTIRQEDVAAAPGFVEAYDRFLKWAGGYAPWILTSWGNYDLRQIEQDCRLHGVAPQIESHLNLKELFASMLGVKKCGTGQALQKVGIHRDGTHHRGIDDARNIVKLLDLLLKRVHENR